MRASALTPGHLRIVFPPVTPRKVWHTSAPKARSLRPSFRGAMAGPIPGLELVHIARETNNVDQLVSFYTEILGFKRMDTPAFGPFQVQWLEFPPNQQMHIIQRNPDAKLPESPLNPGPDSRKDPSALPRGHHLSFRVSDYDSAVKSLKEKGFDVFEKDQQDHRIKQAFFFDPDGNGIEIGSWPK